MSTTTKSFLKGVIAYYILQITIVNLYMIFLRPPSMPANDAAAAGPMIPSTTSSSSRGINIDEDPLGLEGMVGIASDGTIEPPVPVVNATVPAPVPVPPRVPKPKPDPIYVTITKTVNVPQTRTELTQEQFHRIHAEVAAEEITEYEEMRVLQQFMDKDHGPVARLASDVDTTLAKIKEMTRHLNSNLEMMTLENEEAAKNRPIVDLRRPAVDTYTEGKSNEDYDDDDDDDEFVEEDTFHTALWRILNTDSYENIETDQALGFKFEYVIEAMGKLKSDNYMDLELFEDNDGGGGNEGDDYDYTDEDGNTNDSILNEAKRCERFLSRQVTLPPILVEEEKDEDLVEDEEDYDYNDDNESDTASEVEVEVEVELENPNAHFVTHIMLAEYISELYDGLEGIEAHFETDLLQALESAAVGVGGAFNPTEMMASLRANADEDLGNVQKEIIAMIQDLKAEAHDLSVEIATTLESEHADDTDDDYFYDYKNNDKDKDVEGDDNDDDNDSDLSCVEEHAVKELWGVVNDAVLTGDDISESLEKFLSMRGMHDVDVPVIPVVKTTTPKSTTSPESASSLLQTRNLKQHLLETPIYPKTMEKIDELVEFVAGYNEVVDRFIDYLGGDEEDGSSVGKNLGRFLNRQFAKVEIPVEWEYWRKKAGLSTSTKSDSDFD